MASTLCSRTPSLVLSSSKVRRRLPLVGAICVLSLGLSQLYSRTTSSPVKTGCAQSLLLLRSNFGTKAQRSDIRMEDQSANTVPSIVVYVTVPNREAGKKLARSIVEAKLAACVNILPGVESVYQWQGEIQTDAEELLIIKTRQSLLDALTEHVKANHEYEVPEVISLPITGGNNAYLEWLKKSTRE